MLVFKHQVLADILCVKMAYGPFTLYIIKVFILFTKGSTFVTILCSITNIFGQSKLQTDDQ